MQKIEPRVIYRTLFIFRILFIFLVLGLVGVLAAVNHYFQRDAQALVEHAHHAEGIINNKNCANAGLVYYTFSAEGKEYRGSSNACVSSCAKANMGDKVDVTYAIANPQNSICGSAETAASRFDVNYYALLVIALGLIVLVVRSTARKVE